jgi:ubiquinone/menaquinone biosynthesis C-methylase UbiE
MSAMQSILEPKAASGKPSPLSFFQTVQSYQRSFILKAGVELDVFTAIAKGSQTAAEIARACSASERGVRVLCDCLTVMGHLSKEDGRYSLTQDSAAFLDSRSPAYMGRALSFLLDPQQVAHMQNLTQTVRDGHPAPDTYSMNPDDRMWVEFARGMAPLMFPPAQRIAQLLRPELEGKPAPKVLDIAAGHGVFGVTVGETCHTAQIYALDWPKVLEVARETAVAHGVSSRYHLLPGSAFDVDWGTGYEAVLLPNFLHHFDEQTCTALLKKANAALNPGGQVVILEFVPNEDRVSPPIPAMFSMTMLSTTPSGDAYTFPQFKEMCGKAGFTEPKLMQMEESPESLLLAKKP